MVLETLLGLLVFAAVLVAVSTFFFSGDSKTKPTSRPVSAMDVDNPQRDIA